MSDLQESDPRAAGRLRLRAADVDRDRVAERLRAAAAEGRLTPEELEDRLEVAFAARTLADLQPLVADLPPERRGEARLERTPRSREPVAFLVTAALLVAIWALTGAGYFWPVWPILGWGVFALGPARRLGFPACRPSASSRP